MSGSKSGMVIVAVVLAGILVFGGILTAAVALLIKKRRSSQLTDQDTPSEDHQLRSTTLLSVDDCQPKSDPYNFVLEDRGEQHLSPITRANFSTTPSPTTVTVAASLLPSISSSSNTMSSASKFFNTRGDGLRREGVMRPAIPHEPPDPDVLLYRLKSSGKLVSKVRPLKVNLLS